MIKQQLRLFFTLTTLFACLIMHGMNEREVDNIRLVIAAQEGDLDTVQFLLAPRAHANTTVVQSSKVAATPLTQAAERNHIAVIRFLLENQADPNLAKPVEQGGETALTRSATFGHIEAADILLNAKADPDIANSRGVTPLAMASEGGYTTIVSKLLAAKADVNSQANKQGDFITALTQASHFGHDQIVDVLLKAQADPNLSIARGFTPLLVASASGNTAIVKLLLDAQSNVHKSCTANNYSPLHMAVDGNHTQVVRLLIAAGARQDLPDKKGNLPIAYAKTKQMRLLLRKALSREKNKEEQ